MIPTLIILSLQIIYHFHYSLSNYHYIQISFIYSFIHSHIRFIIFHNYKSYTKQCIMIWYINTHHLRLILSWDFLSSMFVYFLIHEISIIHVEVHITVIVTYYIYCDINFCLNLLVWISLTIHLFCWYKGTHTHQLSCLLL